MGAEMVKRVQPRMRGTTVGGFVTFQDLAYGATGPLASALANRTVYVSIFLISCVAVTLGLSIIMPDRRAPAGSANF